MQIKMHKIIGNITSLFKHSQHHSFLTILSIQHNQNLIYGLHYQGATEIISLCCMETCTYFIEGNYISQRERFLEFGIIHPSLHSHCHQLNKFSVQCHVSFQFKICTALCLCLNAVFIAWSYSYCSVLHA